MSRHCGYCREIGHTSNICRQRLGQIDAIRYHASRERKAVHDMLLRNGLGIGAIIRQKYYGDAGKECVITSLKDSVIEGWDNLVEYSIVKYRKSVRSRLRSWTGIQHADTTDLVSYVNVNRMYIRCRSLEDMTDNTYAIFYMSELPQPPEWAAAQKEKPGFFMVGSSSEILCPSDETDVIAEDFMRPVMIHDRLGKSASGHTRWDRPYPP